MALNNNVLSGQNGHLADHDALANHYNSHNLTVGSTAPSSPAVNDLWYDVTNKVMKSWNGTIWDYSSGGGGGTGGHTIQDEGVALASRTNLNFTGAGVTVTDDASNNATKVVIPQSTPMAVVNQTVAAARYTAAQQTLPASGTPVTVQWTTQMFDNTGYWSSANPTRITIPQSGTYRIWGTVDYANLPSNTVVEAFLDVNGGAKSRAADNSESIANAGGARMPYGGDLYQFAAGDYVELKVLQSSTSTTSVSTATGTAYPTTISIERIDQANVSTGTPNNILGLTSYNPTARAVYNTASTTGVTVDANNLKVTFTAPASGRVIVKLSATAYVSTTNTAGGMVYWGLRDANGDLAGTYVMAEQVGANTGISAGNPGYAGSRVTTEIPVSGLTPGQVYTWYWGYMKDTNATSAYVICGGGNGSDGPAAIEVLDGTVGQPNNSFPTQGINQPYLAVTSYSGQNYTAMNSSNTLTTLDTTNVKVTFTAPASGRVVVGVNLPFYALANVAGQACDFKIVDGSNSVVQGASARAIYFNNIESIGRVYTFYHNFVMTGLTPGQTYTWYLAYQNQCSTFSISTASDGPLVMTVQDAVLSPNMTQQSPNPFLLGLTKYAPATRQTPFTTSTTPVAVDSTNLKVSFVAPASGQVRVVLSGFAYMNLVNTPSQYFWSLRDGSGEVSGTRVMVLSNNSATTQGARLSPSIVVSGLTPGQQYTWYWAYMISGGSNNAYVLIGPGTDTNEGPAIMEVWDATAGQGSVQTPPGLTTLGRFRGYLGAGVTANNATTTTLTGWTATDDPLGGYQSSSSGWRAPTTGTYVVSTIVQFGASASGGRQVTFNVNGTAAANIAVPPNAVAGQGTGVDLQRILRLNAGDVVTVVVYQDSGAAITIGSGNGQYGTFFEINQLPDTSHNPSAVSSSGVIGGRIYQAAAQTIPTNGSVYTKITFDTADFDKGGFYASPTPGRLTVPSGGGGIYRINAQVTINSLSSGTLGQLVVWKNGVQAQYDSVHASSGNYAILEGNITIQLNAGDYIEVGVTQNTAGSQATVPGTGNTFLEVIRENSVALTDPTNLPGDMIVRGTGGALARLAGSDGQVPVWDSTSPLGITNKTLAPYGQGIAQPYLARVYSASGTGWISTTSTTMTAVIASQLSVTFTAPASGQVIVQFNGLAQMNAANADLVWGLVDTNGNQVGGVEVGVVQGNNTASAFWQRQTAELYVSGLNPGQSYTWRWAHRVTSAGISGQTYAGTATYPAMMTVQDAALSPNMTAQSPNPFLLGRKVYNGPATVSTTSTTPVAIDSSNLTVSFVAPASGTVIARMAAEAWVSAAGGIYWSLLSGGSMVPNSNQLVSSTVNATARTVYESVISGLTPGQQYTWQWAHSVNVNTITGNTRYDDGNTAGGSYGPAIMEIWDGTAGQGSVQTPPGLTTLGRFRGYLTANQSLTNGTNTRVAGFTVTDDPLGKWDSTNNDWVAPATGTYVVACDASFASNATGQRGVSILVNGTTSYGISESNAVNGDNTSINLTRLMRLNTGDTVAMLVFQSSGASLNLLGGTTGGNASTAFEIQQLPDTSHAPSATSASQVIGARAYITAANQALAATGTWYPLQWGATEFDKGGFWNSSNPTRLTVPPGAGGTYRINTNVVGQSNANSYLAAQIWKNGNSNAYLGYSTIDGSYASWITTTLDRTVDLNPGDYIEIAAAQNNYAGSQVIGQNGSAYVTYVELIRVNSVALTDPTTTKGDMVVRSSSGALGRLAAGSDGTLPVADSTQALGVRYGKRLDTYEATGDNTGDKTATSLTYIQVPGLATVTLPAVAGDVLLLDADVNFSSASAGIWFDMCFSVAGTAKTDKSNRTVVNVANYSTPMHYKRRYVVQSSDISGGNVTVGVMYKTVGVGGSIANSSPTQNQTTTIVPNFVVTNTGQ